MSERPTIGYVYAVRNSPGPLRDIRFDVVGVSDDGSEVFFENAAQSGAMPEEYDVTITPDSEVLIGWRRNSPRFKADWLPLVTECTGQGMGVMFTRDPITGAIIRVEVPPGGPTFGSGGIGSPSGFPAPPGGGDT